MFLIDEPSLQLHEGASYEVGEKPPSSQDNPMEIHAAQGNKSLKKWLLFICSNFVCECILHACMYVYMRVSGACRDQKRVSQPVELQWYHVGAKSQSVSSVRAANACNLCHNCTCRGLLCEYEGERRGKGPLEERKT